MIARLTARICLALVVVVGVSGCGDLPRPFEPGTRAPFVADGLRPADAAGVAVTAPSGVAGAIVARAVAVALREAEVPAAIGAGNVASARLIGRWSAGATRLAWSLVAADGKPLDAFVSPISRGGLDRRAIDALAASAAARVVARLRPEDVARRPALAVAPVIGAPDGGALRRAMVRALTRGGAALGDGDAAHTVLGTLIADRPTPERTRLEVVWELVASDGRRLGVVRQENTVASAAFDGAWTAIARAIADNAAPGVLDLLAREAPERPATPETPSDSESSATGKPVE